MGWQLIFATPLLFFVTMAPPVPADEAEQENMPPQAQRDASDYYELYRTLADTLDQVERNYVQPLDRRELMEAAIQGIVRKLDQHSGYIPPEELDSFRDTVANQFAGIGIRVALEQGRIQVLSPLVGSPAYRAGLQSGDRIASIDDQSTDQMSLDDAVALLKGPAGSQVKLGIVRPDSEASQDITLTRELIHVKTVLGFRRDANDRWDYWYDREQGLGLVRITAFSRETPGDLRKVLEQLDREGLQGLVIDVRNNPGGLLSAAIEICDLFVATGKIVSTAGRNTKPRTWNASQAGTYEKFPIVLLVNRFSASASEVLAGCLQDHDRAIVVGERTWGKGSVQNVIQLHGGQSALKLTTASYLRPSGKNIHRFPNAKPSDDWGVRPSPGFEVRFSNPEMTQFILARRQLDRLTRPGEKPPQAPPDRQLRKALDYLSQEIAQAGEAVDSSER